MNLSGHRGSRTGAERRHIGRTARRRAVALTTAFVCIGSIAAASAWASGVTTPVAQTAGKPVAKTYHVAGTKGIYPGKLLQSVIDRLYLTVYGSKGLPNPRLAANGAPAGYTFQPHTITTSAKCYMKVRPTTLTNHGSWVNNRLYFARWSRKGTLIKPCATGSVHNVRDPLHTVRLTLRQTCPSSRPAAKVKVCRAMAFRPTIVEAGQTEIAKLADTLGAKLGAYGAVHKLRFDEGGFNSSSGAYMHRVKLFFNRSSAPNVPALKELVVTVAKHHRLAVTPYFY